MKAKQIAALPLKRTSKGKLRILLVTSRETKRWIVPKGWPMDGKTPWRAAEIEALEEAGVIGRISKKKFTQFSYKKRLRSGKNLPCRVDVFPMYVKTEKSKWLERKQRTRKWVSLKKAARMVEEKELKKALKSIAKNPELLNEPTHKSWYHSAA